MPLKALGVYSAAKPCSAKMVKLGGYGEVAAINKAQAIALTACFVSTLLTENNRIVCKMACCTRGAAYNTPCVRKLFPLGVSFVIMPAIKGDYLKVLLCISRQSERADSNV